MKNLMKLKEMNQLKLLNQQILVNQLKLLNQKNIQKLKLLNMNAVHIVSIYSDKDGLWGAEHGKWCIIPDYCQKEYEECWSVKYGYSCCDHCKVHSSDKHGSWGVMNKNWCGIPNSC